MKIDNIEVYKYVPDTGYVFMMKNYDENNKLVDITISTEIVSTEDFKNLGYIEILKEDANIELEKIEGSEINEKL